MSEAITKYINENAFKKQQIIEDVAMLVGTIEVLEEQLKHSTPNADIQKLIEHFEKEADEYESAILRACLMSLEQLINKGGS